MRKLLVASQKSGVGKTTTAINLAAGTALAGARALLVETDPLNNVGFSMNLAQHGSRKPLREAGIDLPGVLCTDVLPGLDVLSPYEEGSCTDDDLDRLLHLLSLDAFSESYDCLVINAPPFFGGRSAQLLASADEFIIVMQAEPLAHRTMPAFLEMVQRATQGEEKAARLRGILLTLPENEAPGGRWERELRGRFGSRVLTPVIPYDGEWGRASVFGTIVLLQFAPEAPASLAYHEVVAELQLARDAKRAARPVEATLSVAAATVKEKPFEPRTPPVNPRRSSARQPRLRLPTPAGNPGRAEPRVEAADSHAPSQPEPVVPSRVSSRPAETASSPAPKHAPEAPPPAMPPWVIWVGLSIAAGVGLRFIELPDFALPLAVGLSVAAAVTLLLHLFVRSPEEEQKPATDTPLARSDGHAGRLPRRS